MLEINNCCKSFGNHTVLQDVSLTIPDGSIIGMSGASGIGKSTLAKILCGVTAPDAGAVFLDGKLLVSPKEAYDRKRGLAIQMVYQQPHATLDPSQKIGAGLRELISYHRLTKNRQETEKLIADILAQMLPNGGSVLFISHDWALANFYCDTVYEFDETHQLKEVRA